MSRKMTLSECFAFFGASGANSRWSWSARSADGGTVVITLWSDRLTYRGNEVTYESVSDGTGPWTDRPGNRERIENLKWARDHCDGCFKAVITVARSVNEEPRQIKECFPQPNLRMKLIELNETTGEFRARHIPYYQLSPRMTPTIARVGRDRPKPELYV